MPFHYFYDPVRFLSEFLYTGIIVLLCFLIYFKTKEVYDLTKYEGIRYFRNAFIFFGLAYIARFALPFLQLSGAAFGIITQRIMVFPLFMVIVSYLSTMAIFYLTYSTIWKKIKYKNFITLSNITAAALSIIAFLTRSPFILSMLQFLLLVFAIIITAKKHKKGKKKSYIKALYFSVFFFWLINLFVLDTRSFFRFEFKIIFQIISVIIFVIIFFRIKKWIK